MPPRIAPKKAKTFYTQALDYDVHLSFDVPEDVVDPFDAPEFYPPGLIATITKNDAVLTIHRKGDIALTSGDYIISSHQEFRENFPDGEVGDSDAYEWTQTGWFEIHNQQTGEKDAVLHSLSAAIAYAIENISLQAHSKQAAIAAIDAYLATHNIDPHSGHIGGEPVNTENTIFLLLRDLHNLVEDYKNSGIIDTDWDNLISAVPRT